MFKILFISVTLYIQVYDCYHIYKREQPNIHGEMEMLFKRIKKLASYLPDHNVEIQLELYGPNPPPHRKLVHVRKLPQRAIHLREIDPMRNVGGRNAKDEATAAATPTESKTTTTAPTAPLQHPTMPHYFTQQALPMHPPHLGFGADPMDAVIGRQDTAPGTGADGEKKPVYMDDLKKALKEFEDRVFAKQEKKTEAPLDAKVVEEGKQPLLKKDLWMALGLKFLKGCSDQAHNHMQTPRGAAVNPPLDPSVLITQRPPTNQPLGIKGPFPTPMAPVNPKANNLLQLIQRVRNMAQASPYPTQRYSDTQYNNGNIRRKQFLQRLIRDKRSQSRAKQYAATD